MRDTRRHTLASQSGAALLTTVIVLGMLTALVAAYGANVRGHLGLRGAASIERLGFYTAEGGLNVGVTRFANIFRDSGIPDGSDYHQEVTIADRTADVTLAGVTGCNPCPPTVVPQGELFAGLNSIPYRYTVQSLSINDAGDTEAHVAGEFDIHTIPIFQFLAFIDAHLFIMPQPNMTLHGRLHSNNRVHLQPDATLKVEDLRPPIPEVQVTASDRIYRGGYKYDDAWRCWGTVTIDKLQDTVAPFNDLDPKNLTCGAGTGPVSDATLAGWKGSMKQDVANIVTPDVGLVNRSGEHWQASELRVVLRLDQARAAIDFGAADLCPLGMGTCSNDSAVPCTVATAIADCGVGNLCSLTSPALYQIEVQDEHGNQDVTKTRALWRFMCERRGALFYTDVPTNPPTPPNGNATFVGTATNYVPAFINNRRIYRRIGEDTSGNGVISSNTDRNDDICPPGNPWYQPPDCTQAGRPDAGSWYSDLDYRRGAFWNHRELQYMYLLNVNVRALIEWNKWNGDPLYTSADNSDFGLVWFLTVVGPNSAAATNNYAVRVFDSADLDTKNTTFPTGLTDPTGLTIVSDQGVIVEGNYNYKDKYPSAIMSDAQWVLSQGWEVAMQYNATPGNVVTCSVFPPNGPATNPVGTNCVPNDQKSVYDLATNMRDVPASDLPGAGAFNNSTSLGINAALLFGLGPSTLNVNYYNGGLENFPRFLEDWGPRTMNYRGSFVSLGAAQHKLANWQCGSGNACLAGVYEPPTRAYDYDGDFNTVAKLPPKTPKIVYVQQLLYTRIFN